MKSLYESILDDEEVLIEKTIKSSLWTYVYELLKDKKENEAIKILNDKFKPNLIKELDLKQVSTLFDEWVMEL